MFPAKRHHHRRSIPLSLAVLLACTYPVSTRADTATWSSAISGSWSNAADWSPAVVPNNGTPVGTTYDALINATGGSYTISTGSPVALNSLTVNSPNATVNLFGGNGTTSFSFANGLSILAGKVQLTGSSDSSTRVQIVDSAITVAPGVSFVMSGNAALSNVNLLAGTISSFGGGSVINGITLGSNAALRVTNGAGGLGFLGTQTVSGTGTILLQGNVSGTAGTVTLASGMTVRPDLTGNSPGGTLTMNGFVNEGNIVADKFTVAINSSAFTNEGILSTINGGTLSLAGACAEFRNYFAWFCRCRWNCTFRRHIYHCQCWNDSK